MKEESLLPGWPLSNYTPWLLNAAVLTKIGPEYWEEFWCKTGQGERTGNGGTQHNIRGLEVLPTPALTHIQTAFRSTKQDLHIRPFFFPAPKQYYHQHNCKWSPRTVEKKATLSVEWHRSKLTKRMHRTDVRNEILQAWCNNKWFWKGSYLRY